MKIKKFSNSVCACLVIAALILSSVILNVGAAVLPAKITSESKEGVTSLTADFSGLTQGAVKDGVTVASEKDTATINYLNERFAFYAFQDLSKAWKDLEANGTRRAYFERNDVNGYINDIRDGLGRFPDTAARTDWSLDGITNLGGGAFRLEGAEIPTWTVDGKYIHCTAYAGSENYNFRQENIMYFRGNTPTTLAVFKNFELNMNFKFKTEAELGGTNPADSIAVVFDSITAGDLLDKKYSVFTATPDGKYYLGSFSDYWQLPEHTMQLTDNSGNNASFERGKEYRLKIKRVGKTVTVTFTDAETNTIVAAASENNLPLILQNQGGYVGITGSNAGAKYADIVMTRLNDKGEPVNYGNSVNGYSFGVGAQGLADYRSHYRCNENALNDKWNIWQFRDQNNKYGTYPYNFSEQSGNGQRVFAGTNDVWLGSSEYTKMVSDYLDNYMSVYYEGVIAGNNYFGKADKFWHRPNPEMNLKFWPNTNPEFKCWNVHMRLNAACHDTAPMILAQSDLGWDTDQRLLSGITTLAPKKSDGTDIYTENFETRFSLRMYDNGTNKRATALSFRSDKAGVMLGDDNNGYTGKATLLFSNLGWKLYDGTAVPMEILSYNSWADNDTAGGDVDIYVKAVGSALTIKVTRIADGKVLLDTVETVNTEGAGYLYYSACHEIGFFYSFDCNVLDNNGNITNWNSSNMKSLYEEEQLLPIGRAGVVGNVLQMDWSNSGFHINGNISGELSVMTNAKYLEALNAPIVFNVIVDGGKPYTVEVEQGLQKVVLAENLPEAEHTVDVISAHSPWFKTLDITDIFYNGTLSKVKKDNGKIKMLAIGDSITAGFGIYGDNSTDDSIRDNHIKTTNGYYSYAAIAARAINADIDVVANEAATISEMHERVNKLNKRSGAPDWNWAENQNDIIVINLGTNDEVRVPAAQAYNDAMALLRDMRAKNPDAYIIWMYGMMSKNYKDTVYEKAVKDMNDAKIFALETEPATSGMASHPNAAEHEQFAKELEGFIREKCSDLFAHSEHTETIKELNDSVKVAFKGRSKWNGEGISSVYGAAGIAVNGYMYGDVAVKLAYPGDGANIVRLEVIIDGESKTMEFARGTEGFITVGNLPRGNHTVEIRRAYSDWGELKFEALKYSGTLEKADYKDIQMEFLGDSITVGEGIYGWVPTETGESYVRYQNSLKGYAARTAMALDADFSMIAHSGAKTQGILDEYKRIDSEYVLGADKKDIVVINLGTNDVGLPSNTDAAVKENTKAAVKGLIDAVVAKNGKDVCIVWAYGMMTVNNKEFLQAAVEEAAGDSDRIMFCDLSAAVNNGGNGNHPDMNGNIKAAEILSGFISEKVIPLITEKPSYDSGDANGDGEIDIRDLICIKKYLLDMNSAIGSGADYNRDGKIDSLDLASIRKLLLKIE